MRADIEPALLREPSQHAAERDAAPQPQMRDLCWKRGWLVRNSGQLIVQPVVQRPVARFCRPDECMAFRSTSAHQLGTDITETRRPNQLLNSGQETLPA